ncbi:MAG TPA: DUF4391 domain-containing protein [Luteolibacter sp.]
MEILDNVSRLWGDDLQRTLVPGAKLKIAASCFSIFAYEALKAELEQVESIEFIFTSPTFVEGLQTIDRAIPFPIFHRLHGESGIAFSAAYKRPSEADASQWVTGARFTTPFARPLAEYPPLPAALDLGHLYAALFAPLLPLPPRPGEDLPAHIDRCEAFLRLRRQIDQLTTKLHREKQFNRKVELNQQLKPLLAQAAALTGEPLGARNSFRPISPVQQAE